VLIETTKAIFNNRRRVKFVLKDIEFIRRSYILISTLFAFTAIKADGSIKVWGNSAHGETSAPSTGVYTKVYSNAFAFAALNLTHYKIHHYHYYRH
jgi:hypothetical protein